VVLEEKKKQ